MRSEMPQFQPRDPNYAERVRASFRLQHAMSLIGAEMALVEPGYVEIHLPHKAEITQQHGFIHGGVVGMIADSAAGYAANTLTPADTSVLTVEYKMNMVAPADGQRIIESGLAAGDTIVVNGLQRIRPGATVAPQAEDKVAASQ